MPTHADSLISSPLLTHIMSAYTPYTGTYRPPYTYQCPPIDSPALPSMSTMALQDIVEGQQRTTNGLVSLLSHERTTSESNTREQKQQLANLTSLSQNFLTFMPDIEQKFSSLESSIRANCTNPDNAELQARLKDMVEVVANIGRIAEGFACSTGLRLVPVRNLATNPRPSHTDRFSEFGAQSVGLGSRQRTATPTGPHILQRDFPAGPALVPCSNPQLYAIERIRTQHWSCALSPLA